MKEKKYVAEKIEVLDKIELHFPYKNVSLCKENQRHRLLMAIFFRTAKQNI